MVNNNSNYCHCYFIRYCFRSFA